MNQRTSPAASPCEPDPNRSLRIATAVALHRCGAPVIALRGKRPRGQGWTDVRADAVTRDEVIGLAREGNIGMPTGSASNIVVVDIDHPCPDDVERALGLADVITVRVTTGRGGRHLYFAAPDGVELPNTVRKLHPNVDTRGGGGQVVLPGSIHPDTGRAYEWLAGHGIGDVDLAPLPAEFLRRWLSAQRGSGGAEVRSVSSDEATANIGALRERNRRKLRLLARLHRVRTCREMGASEEGVRNDTLFNAACRVFELANSGLLDEDETIDQLRTAAAECGLPDDEIGETLHSAAEKVAGQGIDVVDALATFSVRGYARRRRRAMRLVEMHTSAADSHEGAMAQRSRSRLLTMGEFMNAPEPPPLVKDLIYRGELGVIYGPPGSAKTFLALDLALSIAAHNPAWAGRKLLGGPVVYVAGEGLRGLRRRVRAWTMRPVEGERRGVKAIESTLRVVQGGIQVLNPADWDDFRRDLDRLPEPPVLVVLDTLARCMAGYDENSAEFMGNFVSRLDEMRNANGATVLLIHHSNKEGRQERGSSALRGAADVMARVSKDRDIVRMEWDTVKSCGWRIDHAASSARTPSLN